MALMEKMMTAMKVRSLVMVFRTSYGGEGEMRGEMAVALRGTSMDIPVGSRTEVPEHCHQTRPWGLLDSDAAVLLVQGIRGM